ncbi:outer membrane beta-barrel protein [Pedobacter panaciterrae]|uniref:outer membrane beta-barrel protein n=1 Tax=Pedobacter panaciterrae TaxID=363849 RepID=UPI002599B5DC|nr:outer membrane beta-barrel protein [uncultured Pedobacter sp.]
MEHTDRGLEVIKSLLQNNEEAYKEGSWESFSKQQPAKTKTSGWYWFSGIAASLLLICLAFIFSYNPDPKPVPLAKFKTKPVQKEVIQEVQVKKLNTTNHHPVQINKKQAEIRLVNSTIPEQDKPAPENTMVAQAKPNEEQIDAGRAPRSKKIIPYTTYQETESVKKTKKEPNWIVGLGMATDFSNSKKLGLAFEAVVGYALNPKITIMLGAGYRESSAFKNNEGQTLSATDEKQLESATVRLSGVEIPLGLRYNVNQRLYAKVGVSAFATIKQRGELTYVSTVSHTQSIVDPNGEVYDKTFTSEERSVVDIEDQPQNKEKYKSFINISFGYKYPFLKNRTITLEPFFKLPMQSSKIENVKFSSAGLRLGIDF